MPDANRREPIVNLTDAPTAEEEDAIGSGLARSEAPPAGSVAEWMEETKQELGTYQYAASPLQHQREGARREALGMEQGDEASGWRNPT